MPLLVQTLYRLRETRLARQELEQVVTSTQFAIKPQDLKDDRREARRLLGHMGEGYSP